MGGQKGRLGKLSKKHGVVVRELLQGKTFRQIAEVTGISRTSAHQRWKWIEPRLHEKTLQRIRQAAIGRRVPLSYRQQVVDHFLKHLAESPGARGVFTKTENHFGVGRNTLIRHLILSGVNPVAEVQRRKLQILLRLAKLRRLTHKRAAGRFGVSPTAIARWRNWIAKGKHLQGALEMVESPESHLWWDIAVPGVSSSSSPFFYPGSGRIDIGVRNKTIEKDLALFDESTRAARNEMAKWHPDKPENRTEKSKKLFDRASQHWLKLKRAKGRYVEREKKFRKKYGLPMHVSLE